MQNHWIVDLNFEEGETETSCTATLNGFSAPGVKAVGTAKCNPADDPDSKIGEELAAARACSNLAHQLVDQAAMGIESHTHQAAHLNI